MQTPEMNNKTGQEEPVNALPWHECHSKKQRADYLNQKLNEALCGKTIFWEQDYPGTLNMQPLEYQALAVCFGEIQVKNGIYETAENLDSIAAHMLDYMAYNEGLPAAEKGKLREHIKLLYFLSGQFRWIYSHIHYFD